MFEFAIRRQIGRPLWLACALAAGCCALIAQPGGPGGPPPGGPPGQMQSLPDRGPSVDKELKQLTRLLKLTTDQQAQVKTVLTDQHQQIDAVFKQEDQRSKASANTNGGDDGQSDADAITEMRNTLESIRKDSAEKIAAILTDAQKTKFAAWEKKREKNAAEDDEDMGPPPGGGPPGGGGGPPGGGGGPPGI